MRRASASIWPLVPLLALVSGGCAVAPGINGGASLAVANAVAFRMRDTPGPPVQSQVAAREAVARRLVARGWTMQTDAPVIVDVGLGMRPAQTDVDGAAAASVSPARRRQMLLRCRPQIVRLSVGIIDASAGSPMRQSWSEGLACPEDQAALLDRLADRIVQGSGLAQR